MASSFDNQDEITRLQLPASGGDQQVINDTWGPQTQKQNPRSPESASMMGLMDSPDLGGTGSAVFDLGKYAWDLWRMYHPSGK